LNPRLSLGIDGLWQFSMKLQWWQALPRETGRQLSTFKPMINQMPRLLLFSRDVQYTT
jgi:hypothetical protein